VVGLETRFTPASEFPHQPLDFVEKHKMADKQQPPRYVALYRQANDLAMGEHPLSKYVPPLLLLADALLTSLIISKVACKLLLF
jgi:hypothetical protein